MSAEIIQGVLLTGKFPRTNVAKRIQRIVRTVYVRLPGPIIKLLSMGKECHFGVVVRATNPLRTSIVSPATIVVPPSRPSDKYPDYAVSANDASHVI